LIKTWAFLLVAFVAAGCARNTPPAPNTPAPEVAFDRITFERDPGMGNGPQYTLIIDRQGKAELFGCQLVPIVGVFTGSVELGDLMELSQFLAAHDFYRDMKPDMVLDASTIGLDIEVHRQHIKFLAADTIDVRELGKIVDGIAFTTRWYGRPTAPPFSSLSGRTRKIRLAANLFRLQLPAECKGIRW
jgi:hypothetical protein